MRRTHDPEDIERREHAAYASARAAAPERTASQAVLGRSEGEPLDGDREDAEAEGKTDQDDGADAALNWATAEQSRPDAPGETEDGLDETAEEVRRAAEDMPSRSGGGRR